MEKEEKVLVDETIVVNEDIKKEDENPTENTQTEDTTLEPVDDNTVLEPEEDITVANKEDENPTDDVTTVPPVEDTTLAPTDDVIPAPVEAPADAPLADIVPPEFDVPVDAPVDTPVEPVTTDAPVDVPAEIPAEPAPVAVPEEPMASDVVPEVGDETPMDGCPGCDDTCQTCDNPVTIGNFFGTLQECITIAWRFHLKTRKHHIHVTLNEFYDKALDIVDDIIEQYQGICGIVEEPFVNCIVGDGKTEGEYLTELKAFVENNKCVLGCHSEIDSTIDEFLGLIDSTLYKLTSFTESAVKSFEEFVYEDYQIEESCCGEEEEEEE